MQIETTKQRPMGRPPSLLCLKKGDWKADHLRELRQGRRLTMEQLAAAVHVTRMMIHLAEKGQQLSPRLANALITFFDVPTAELIVGSKQIFLVDNATTD